MDQWDLRIFLRSYGDIVGYNQHDIYSTYGSSWDNQWDNHLITK